MHGNSMGTDALIPSSAAHEAADMRLPLNGRAARDGFTSVAKVGGLMRTCTQCERETRPQYEARPAVRAVRRQAVTE